jgi:hypothetical protein
MAAGRASVPRIIHTYHGFPFHEFQSRGRRNAYVAIERHLGRVTDVAFVRRDRGWPSRPSGGA